MLEVIEDQPASKLLRKGETIAGGVARLRRDIATKSAELAEVQRAPWPTASAKSEPNR